jgi:hypothetical protein
MGWLGTLFAEHLGQLPDLTQFILALIVGNVRSFANFQHPATAHKAQAAQQEFTLSIRQFQLQ